MILFIGDSFTWGQGLSIPYLLQKGKTIDEINHLTPPQFACENYDYGADEYRKKYHFPNLVAKHFNRPYGAKWGNGGNNSDIEHIIKNIHVQLVDVYNAIDFYIIQFTESQRDINLKTHVDNGENPDEILYNHCLKTIQKIDNVCKEQNNKWFGFSWHSDIGNILETEYAENYIPILFNNTEYNNFEILREQCEFCLDCTIDNRLHDSHLNSDGHVVIANSIIRKIENSDIY